MQIKPWLINMYTNEEISNLREAISSYWEEYNDDKVKEIINYLLINELDALKVNGGVIDLERINFNDLSDIFDKPIIFALCANNRIDIALEYALLEGVRIDPDTSYQLLSLIGHDGLDSNYDFNNFKIVLDETISQNRLGFLYFNNILLRALEDHGVDTIRQADYIYLKMQEHGFRIDDKFASEVIEEIAKENRWPHTALEWLGSNGINHDYLKQITTEHQAEFDEVPEEWLEAAPAPQTAAVDLDMDIEMMPTAELSDAGSDTDDVIESMGNLHMYYHD